MFRGIALAALAAATIGAAALAPTAASAGGKHHNWKHRWHTSHVFTPFTYYAGYDDCYVRRVVRTRYGKRVVRWVNVCRYY